MVTMVDEIWDRQYRSGRAQLNHGLSQAFGSLGRTIGKSLATLHRIEWSAPWAAQPASSARDVGCA